MLDSIPPWLWIVFTVAAAGAQVARNAMQRGLTAELGTAGAAHVRFIFGLPFALVFLAVTWAVTEWPAMQLDWKFLYWLAFGAVSQILATAWMLNAMQQRSFVVTTAAIKTEPIQVAVFGAIILSERIGLVAMLAVVIATLGVVLMSWPRKVDSSNASGNGSGSSNTRPDIRPIMVGVAAGGMFAFSAVGFRGAILSVAGENLGGSTFYIYATLTLACGLLLQSTLIVVFLLLSDRAKLRAILAAWRPSVLAGLAGATASQFWFLAFAIESVARVRTLALVEVLFAQIISRRIFSQSTSKLEGAGIALIVIGVIVLLNS
ncbi:hypothetical protein AB833_31005 [Chromatiales bacterium (ex Bugula neritina AB1)]|nr:hypothetical protein AB833_31005 [Chromatiales bacterium (ex Bugula neritina AB1)]